MVRTTVSSVPVPTSGCEPGALVQCRHDGKPADAPGQVQRTRSPVRGVAARCSGREPVIVGTGFPVRSVVTSIYRPGMTPEEMLKAWPYLTLAHVHDALSFHHDHRAVIDRAIRENRETAVRRGAADLDAVPKGRGVSRGAAPTYPFRDVDRLSGMHIGFIT